jgi:hypothetical protein
MVLRLFFRLSFIGKSRGTFGLAPHGFFKLHTGKSTAFGSGGVHPVPFLSLDGDSTRHAALFILYRG